MSSDILHYQQQEQSIDTTLDLLLLGMESYSHSILELFEKRITRFREKRSDIYEDVSGYYSLEVSLHKSIAELLEKTLAFRRGYANLLGAPSKKELNRVIKNLRKVGDTLSVSEGTLRKNIIILEEILALFRNTVSHLQAHAASEMERIMLTSSIKPLDPSDDPLARLEE